LISRWTQLNENHRFSRVGLKALAVDGVQITTKLFQQLFSLQEARASLAHFGRNMLVRIASAVTCSTIDWKR
jgi:hypothetical protein